MMGIGLFAILGLGLAMSAGGGGGDDDIEMEPIEQDDDAFAPDVPNIPLTPPDDVSSDNEARIEAFKAELRNDPDLTDQEAVALLNAFIADLLAEEGGETPAPPVVEAPEPDAPEEVVRPPFGGAIGDPLDNPPQVFVPAPSEPDVPDAGDPAQPSDPSATAEQLVSVTRTSGAEFEDARVIEEGPSAGPDADRDFIVETGLEINNINVGYSSATTFLIKYTGGTEAITAGLNSNIEGPRGAVSLATATETDENGTQFDLLTSSRTFADDADIQLNVTAEQIGAHVAEIDLQNPNDSLNFNFASDVTGNLHLIYDEAEQDSVNDSLVTRTLYVIETPASVSALNPADISRIIAQDGNASQDTRIIAEVNLGFESLNTDGDPADLERYQVTVADFINENPQITTNVAWTSVGENDGSTTTTPGSGTGGGAPTSPGFDPFIL